MKLVYDRLIKYPLRLKELTIKLIIRTKLVGYRIVFFDTYKELGVATEIMGITEASVEITKQMKS